MRDPTDVMTFFQTNMLCEAFTDTNKFQLTDQEKTVQKKIGELYMELRDTIQNKQLETMNLIDKEFKLNTSNPDQNRILIMQDQGEGFVISTQPFMEGILQNSSNDNNLQIEDRNEGNEIYLEYQREGDEEEDDEQPKEEKKKPVDEVKNTMVNLTSKF